MKLATLCYVKKGTKTLMMYRSQRPGDIHGGKWNGLGGKIHFGETPEECVIREIKEESNLAIRNPSLRGVLTFPAFKDEEDWYVYVFTAHEFSGTLEESSEGKLEWIDDDKILSLDLWEGDPIFLKCLNQNQFFSGKFVYQAGKLVNHQMVIHDWKLNEATTYEAT